MATPSRLPFAVQQGPDCSQARTVLSGGYRYESQDSHGRIRQLRRLGHLPSPVPLLASEEVRLYRRSTEIGDLVAAVLEPSEGGDQRLIDYAENTDREIVAQIREVLDSYR